MSSSMPSSRRRVPYIVSRASAGMSHRLLSPPTTVCFAAGCVARFERYAPARTAPAQIASPGPASDGRHTRSIAKYQQPSRNDDEVQAAVVLPWHTARAARRLGFAVGGEDAARRRGCAPHRWRGSSGFRGADLQRRRGRLETVAPRKLLRRAVRPRSAAYDEAPADLKTCPRRDCVRREAPDIEHVALAQRRVGIGVGWAGDPRACATELRMLFEGAGSQ